MLPILPLVIRIVSPLVISVVVDRLSKFGKETNWTQLKIDTDRKIRVIVPGEMLDDTVIKFVNRMIDNVHLALRDTKEEERVLKFLMSGQWSEAAQLVLDHAFPDLKIKL